MSSDTEIKSWTNWDFYSYKLLYMVLEVTLSKTAYPEQYWKLLRELPEANTGLQGTLVKSNQQVADCN